MCRSQGALDAAMRAQTEEEEEEEEGEEEEEEEVLFKANAVN